MNRGEGIWFLSVGSVTPTFGTLGGVGHGPRMLMVGMMAARRRRKG
jgi:hypothetical protein